MSGYVRLYRDLLSHPAFRNDAEALAFAWLFARASWRTTRVRYKGRSITLSRGQLAISIRDMGAALDRDKAWVERLFKRLKSESMIETVTETRVSIVTIRNYDKYQKMSDERETENEASREIANETPARHLRDTGETQNKEEKNLRIEEDVVDVACAREDFPSELFECTAELCRIGGIRHIDPKRIIAHQEQVKRWIGDGFDPPTEIAPVIRQCVLDATERISSLEYFDGPVRQAKAKLEAIANGHSPGANGSGRSRSRAHEIDDAARALGFEG